MSWNRLPVAWNLNRDYYPNFQVTFSEEQLAIFDWFKTGKGNLVVRARAGTGKTTTIKCAFEHAPERKILYAVFNKKMQVEARDKITDIRVEVRTLHSLGLKFILQNWPGVKQDDNVEGDRLDSLFDFRNNYEERGLVLKLVGLAKNLTINPSSADLTAICEERDIEYSETDIVACAMEVLSLSKERDEQSRISFNDMVWLPCAMSWVKPAYDLVVIDEAQDQSIPQLTMSRKASRGRIVVVGDDRQMIYNFRGCHADGMRMMKDTLHASELTLTTTYRCPKLVVKHAQSIVSDYKFHESAPDGEVVHVSTVDTCRPGDAILSRLNAPLMPIALSLLRKNVPARIEGRDIGKQLLAMVKSMRAKSVPDFFKRVQSWLDKQISRLTGMKNNEKKIEQSEDIAATLSALAEGCRGIGEVESRINSLFGDTASNSKPVVVLSSVHKAKGLEWPRVFILTDTFRRGKGIEEDNIYYVAITRAMQSLFFVGGGNGVVESKTMQLQDCKTRISSPAADNPIPKPSAKEILANYNQGDVIYGDLCCMWCNHSRAAFKRIGGNEVKILSLKNSQQSIIRKLTGDELTKFLTGEITKVIV